MASTGISPPGRAKPAVRCLRRLVAGLLILTSPCLQAEERITRFHSDVEIREDRSLQVTEQIDVIAENINIRRGIYRDFPTSYPHPTLGAIGVREKTGFELISVELDGQPVPWHQQPLENGVRTYIGDPDRLLPGGAHRYVLRYTTPHQISREGQQDFLRWNVNGQGWAFPIEQLSATVYPPLQARIFDYTAWTGRQGEMGTDYQIEEHGQGRISFFSSRPFAAYEGMTISLVLPPGSLNTLPASGWRLVQDNWMLFSGLVLLLLLPLYYLRAWRAVGQDPDRGVVIADYHPVRGLSPAAHRYVTLNATDDTTLSAALVNMAIKGYLRIEQNEEDGFVIHKTPSRSVVDKPRPLTSIEDVVYRTLFSEAEQIRLGKDYDASVAAAKKRLDGLLRVEWRDEIYRDNRRYSWLGLLIGASALILCGLHLSNATLGFEGLVPIVVFVIFAVSLTRQKFKLITLLPIAVIALSLMQQGEFTLFTNHGMIWLSLLVAGLFLLFAWLLRAPTPFGQKMLDEIAGFRLYLATAEQDRLNILHPPEKTPELFEKLLPYAIALGVENEWNQQFSDVLKRSTREGQAYQPSWYSSSRGQGFNSGRMAANLGAGLSSSVASAATAPRSSSGGFSGGGGAGGGGGGGGGGGW